MGLIRCPECGKEISEFASMCVNCGCPASRFQESKVYMNGVKTTGFYCDIKMKAIIKFFDDGKCCFSGIDPVSCYEMNNNLIDRHEKKYFLYSWEQKANEIYFGNNASARLVDGYILTETYDSEMECSYSYKYQWIDVDRYPHDYLIDLPPIHYDGMYISRSIGAAIRIDRDGTACYYRFYNRPGMSDSEIFYCLKTNGICVPWNLSSDGKKICIEEGNDQDGYGLANYNYLTVEANGMSCGWGDLEAHYTWVNIG